MGFWGSYGVDTCGPGMLKQPRMFGVREYSKHNPRHTHPRPLSSSDMDLKQGDGPTGLCPQAVKLWERVPEENWDFDGDMVMSHILAPLRVERRVRDLDGDVVMRDASNLPIQGTSFPRRPPSSVALGKRGIHWVNGEIGGPISCTEVC